ncbi:MAG: hypothetical protein ABI707_20350 [Ferruginibacter sp.]
MKSFIILLTAVWSAVSGSVYKIIRKQKWALYAIIIFGLVSLSGCFLHYYKVDRANKTDAATLEKLITGGKYFILHANDQSFALTQVKMNNENLEGEVDILPDEHTKYLHPMNGYPNRFYKIDNGIVLYEVHLYSRESTSNKSHFSLPVKDIYQLDVYELDKTATKKSKVVSTIGLSLTAAGIIAIIVAASVAHDEPATSSNTGTLNLGCSPQVYNLNGSNSELAGILYSGAIFAPLQRTDYMPLSGIDPINDKFHLQLCGGSNEELMIHETKLLQVTHEKDNKVLLNHDGKLMVYRRPVNPEKASIGEHQNARKELSAIDESYYSFTNRLPGQNTSDVILDFKKPAGAHTGKLVLRAKNSAWAVYLFKKFKSLYGDSYPALVQQKDKVSREKLLQCELDQSLPLSVSVKDGTNWKFIDYFFTPGNEVPRDMIMEINLTDFKHTNHIQIKLETAYMFWDLDYAGMDFSENLSCTTTYLPAYNVAKFDSNAQLNKIELNGKDIHLAATEHLNIDFAVKSSAGPNLINSYFLVGSGYYHDNTRFEGKPQLSKLATFSQKGAFDKFSRQTFDQMLSLINNNAANGIAAKN